MAGHTKISFPVFRDRRGNRFIFPGLHSRSVTSAASMWSRCRHLTAALGVSEEPETFDVEPDEPFDKLDADAGSSGFAHGSSKVWMIGGPVFDAAIARARTGEGG